MSDARTRRLIAAFARTYDQAPVRGVRAPGRVNLIGEHTDYNDGFCLPLAIDHDVRVVLRPRRDRTVRVLSLEQPGRVVSFGLSRDIPKAVDPGEHWADYVKGCAQVLLESGVPLRGADLALTGDVPLGAGLSSSAALEVATIHALLSASRQKLPAVRIAELAQRAENRYIGVNCGILDQLSSACCVAGRAMLMDCRTLALTHARLPAGVAVVITDSGRRRGLVGSAYNERRRQCEAGAQALGVSHLRDATLPALWTASREGRLDDLARSRCEHVVAENGRTQAAFAALVAGDAVAVGQLMDQSHADLRDRFAVSCPELDDLVAIARALPGCLGSRMTGGGFGGCTVSLVSQRAVRRFVPALTEAYRARHDLPVAVHVTGAAPGAGALALR
jgi:galactokinase